MVRNPPKKSPYQKDLFEGSSGIQILPCRCAVKSSARQRYFQTIEENRRQREDDRRDMIRIGLLSEDATP